MDALLPVANVLGRLLSIFSLAYLMPIAAAIFYNDGTTAEFVAAMVISLGSGLMLYGVTRSHYRELKPRDGFLLVSTVWALMAAIATIPLLLVYDTMSFTDAFFEAMSGLTTTGATVMTKLDDAPPAINLWRHELNWLGGMGIIVLAVAVLPMLGVGGMQLYKAETPGPMKDAKLTARIADTAKALWLVYVGMTIGCAALLHQAGLSWLDAVCHAFSAMSLGGFSTRDASVGAFDDPMVEFILIVFMVIAAMNFATHFVAVRSRDLRTYWRDLEVRGVIGLVTVSCFGVALYVWMEGAFEDYPTALRHVSFNLVSIGLSSGFVSQDYEKWPVFAPLWMMFLANITCSSGSTGGGIKMIRAIILAKQANRELSRLVHPAVVNPVKVGGGAIP
ncbi:MAG TPA: potassium transporter TrkG, partial [Zoogloea sp.]|nr:potassium transporter TrkG [Zoogloea sp.]